MFSALIFKKWYQFTLFSQRKPNKRERKKIWSELQITSLLFGFISWQEVKSSGPREASIALSTFSGEEEEGKEECHM